MILAIGMFAAALTIASFVAQVSKIVKTRDTHSLSTPMWTLSSVAFAIWILYGALLGELPIIIPNVICLVLAVFILTLKLLPQRKREVVAAAITPSR